MSSAGELSGASSDDSSDVALAALRSRVAEAAAAEGRRWGDRWGRQVDVPRMQIGGLGMDGFAPHAIQAGAAPVAAPIAPPVAPPIAPPAVEGNHGGGNVHAGALGFVPNPLFAQANGGGGGGGEVAGDAPNEGEDGEDGEDDMTTSQNLLMAVASGLVNEVKTLLERGADPNGFTESRQKWRTWRACVCVTATATASVCLPVTGWLSVCLSV